MQRFLLLLMSFYCTIVNVIVFDVVSTSYMVSIISNNKSVCSSCWNKPYPIYEVVTILRCLHLKQVCLIHLFSVVNTATFSVLESRVLRFTLYHTRESIVHLNKI